VITQYLRPTAVASAVADDWTLDTGAASKVAAVASGYEQTSPPAHDEEATQLYAFLTQKQAFYFQGPGAGLRTVTAIRWGVRVKSLGTDWININGYTYYGGVGGYYTTNDHTSSGSYHNIVRPLLRWDGGTWTLDDLVTPFALVLHYEADDTFSIPPGEHGTLLCTSVWIEVDGDSPATGILVGPRQAASRRLRGRRLPSGVIEANVPSLRYLDYELGSLLSLSHPDLPSTDGRGADVKAWQRWPVVLVGRETQEQQGNEVLRLRDLRDYLVTFWEPGKTDRNPGDYSDGLAGLTSGGGRTWYRSSSAWVRTPATTVTKVLAYADKLDVDGLLLERAGTNELIQSAFKNGTFTGWTGSGSGTIVADTEELLFDPATSGVAQSAKFTAGNPITTELKLVSTATATIAASTVCRLAIWHDDDSGAALSYYLQRGFDSKYWRDSDQTWQASKTWNALPVTASRARHSSKQIDVGGSGTTLTLAVGVPTTGTVGQINHLYHVQLEKQKWPSSAIVSEGTTYTRTADQLLIQMAAGTEEWPPERGTFRAKVQPAWSAADVAENHTVAYAQHDASNYDWLYYDGVNMRWVFERKAGGTTYRATKSASPVAGTVYTLAARWTSSLGEFGFPTYTISVFVDGTKGTDATAAALTTASAPTLELGCKAAAEQLDGNLWAVEITPQALSDAAVARY
jgi:hypothetical protein